MTDTPLQLASDFASPTREDWEAEVLKVLNRRRPEGKELTIEQAMTRLRTVTVDGLTIEPLYTRLEEHLGHPGVEPFTRGARVRTGAVQTWDVRQLHEDPDVAFTNQQVLKDMERGATALHLRIDPDAIAPADVPAALNGFRPELAPLSVSSLTDHVAAATALRDFWEGNDPAKMHGNFGIDGLAQAALQGTAADLGPHREWVQIALGYGHVRALTVDVLPYDNAGASDVQQLGYAIATGIEYLRDLEAAGIAPEVAFSQIQFKVSADADQFMTIARLRALRALWARVGEVVGVPAGKRAALQHVVTSRRMFTRDDPYVNLLRITIAAFAAAVGGAERITTLPHDTVHGLPTDFSRRMARNVQLLVSEESNIGRVADPAGGSWYVEALTKQLGDKAWALVQDIESEGMIAALASGKVADQIGEANAERATRLAKRTQPITGVSMFPQTTEPEVEVRPRPAAPELGGLRPVRDSEVFEALRDRSATGAPEVFLACLGARRDFGPREMFTTALLNVGGIATPSSEGGTPAEIAARAAGRKFAVLCSSGKVYAEQAIPVATALKEAGVETVYIAGSRKEAASAEADTVLDGEVFAGMDVVAFLGDALDKLGVAK
ncbi:methylmalonyl-CoA mutase family protein [Propionicicella superfundia]|uniref:methylmalonyl-CoA mutase family protein n=1 Tax=Propionicicella superfundia TaxID=348582 RepID=UPI00048A9604|nr:methylmalonyl-CoA mutase family protein [Propionicicella superfundia]